MGDNGNRQQSWILEMYLQLKLTNIKNGPYAGAQNKEESGMTPEFFGSGQERIIHENDNRAVKGEGRGAGAEVQQ